jgi:acetyltransferase
MAETKVDKALNGWRGQPPADREAVALVLVKLSQLAADIPEVREIDLNPLIADERGVIVLDAKIAVAASDKARGFNSNPRLAIRPYPKQWERHEVLRDGTRVLVRPVRPEDETLYPDFLSKVTADDLRLRFFAPIKEFTHAFIAKLTQLDYARAVAFAAIHEDSGELWGVVRLHGDPNHETGEYAILLRSELKGRGLGWLLMQRIIDYARSEGFKRVKGQVLRENTTMIAMCQKLGFEVHDDADDNSLKIVTFELAAAPAKAAE